MGKGKGANYRWAVKVRRNSTIMEFAGVSVFFLKRVALVINKKLNTKVWAFGPQNYVAGCSNQREYDVPFTKRW